MGLGHVFPGEGFRSGFVFAQAEELRLDPEVAQKILQKEHFGSKSHQVERG